MLDLLRMAYDFMLIVGVSKNIHCSYFKCLRKLNEQAYFCLVKKIIIIKKIENKNK